MIGRPLKGVRNHRVITFVHLPGIFNLLVVTNLRSDEFVLSLLLLGERSNAEVALAVRNPIKASRSIAILQY